MSVFQQSPRRTVAVLFALSCTIWFLSGCAAKPTAPSGMASGLPEPAIRDGRTLTLKEKTQQQEDIAQYIQRLTPPERVAYFKAHPEAVQALKP